MIIFCKITQKLIRLKFIVELVFWQQGILLSVTEIIFFFFFFSCQPGFCFWDSDAQGLCSLAYTTCFAQGPSLVLFQNGSTLVSFFLFCCSSVAQLCPTLCDAMDCSMLGFPVPHHLPELAQTHVNWVSDSIQPSHPLSSPSPAFNLSQYQGLFQWVSSSHQVAKALELQHQSFL